MLRMLTAYKRLHALHLGLALSNLVVTCIALLALYFISLHCPAFPVFCLVLHCIAYLHFALSCFNLPCLHLDCLVSPCRSLSWLASFCFVLVAVSYHVLPFLVFPCLILLSCLVFLTWHCTVLHRLALPRTAYKRRCPSYVLPKPNYKYNE